MKRVLDDLDRTIALFSTSGPVLEPSELDEETRQRQVNLAMQRMGLN